MYVSNAKDKENIKKMNIKLNKIREKNKNYKLENSFLENQQRFMSSSNGYAYIKATDCIVNGIKKTCYKFGICNDIRIRDINYKTGNPTSKMLYYIPLKIDKKILEKCIKSILEPHSIKKNHETFSYITLRELKKVI